ncbi:MAG: sel1 repeat family protein, partial [Rhodobacteraceae bacterium]|nr:sel1 repeat family protein [Paracoccaceae bacterium]
GIYFYALAFGKTSWPESFSIESLRPYFAEPRIKSLLATDEAGPDGGTRQEGKTAYLNGDDLRALKVLIPYAAKGDVEAQTLVGFMYSDGLSQRALPNHCVANYWLERAAKSGNGFAQLRLAEKYYRGAGVEKNIEHARALFRTGASKVDDRDIDAGWLVGYVRSLDPDAETKSIDSVPENDLDALAIPNIYDSLPEATGWNSVKHWLNNCHVRPYENTEIPWISLRCCRCEADVNSAGRECNLAIGPIFDEKGSRQKSEPPWPFK